MLKQIQLVKHFTGLQSLLSTLGQVYKEISLLMVLICVCVLTLARSDNSPCRGLSVKSSHF